jgi:hypothetical protein
MLSVITPGVYMGPPTVNLDQMTQLLTPAGFQVFPFNGLAVGGLTDFMQEGHRVLGFPAEHGDCSAAMGDLISDMPWRSPRPRGDVILWTESYSSYHANPGDFLTIVHEFQDYSQRFLTHPGYRVPGYHMYVLLLGPFPATLREVPRTLTMADLAQLSQTTTV